MNPCALDLTQNSRTRLLESAIFCFSEKGFDATGIREIAQLAQANSALVQYHFGGKDGLYRAALSFIFERTASGLAEQPLARPDAPEARAKAIQGLRTLLQNLIQELTSCTKGTALDQAALLLVTREMQAPHSQAVPLVMEHIRPYIEHLSACLRVLRPDLDERRLLDMHMSIYGPIFHLHSNMALTRLVRGDPDFPRDPEDIQKLVDHFTDFSLRGLGIPEAFPNQGV